MLMPRFFGNDFFDDWMDASFERMNNIDRELYGKNAARIMKTDIHERDGSYDVEIDLPGFRKDQITLHLENGYLTVTAEKGLDKDEKDKHGRMIRQERYSGSMQRSFYVGSAMTEEDIHAKFENGVLTLSVPKKAAPKLPECKTIMIEG